MDQNRFTPSGVRLTQHSSRPGELNWLLLPGGPGIGSESLHELPGRHDRIVWQGGWRQPRFQTPNVLGRLIDDAGHFPWIENPSQVRMAFADLADSILESNSRRRQGAPHGGIP